MATNQDKKYVFVMAPTAVEITDQLIGELSKLAKKAREAFSASYQNALSLLMDAKDDYPKSHAEEWMKWSEQELDMLLVLRWCNQMNSDDHTQLSLLAQAFLQEAREKKDSIHCKVERYSEKRSARYKRLRVASNFYVMTCIAETYWYDWDFFEARFFEMDGFYRSRTMTVDEKEPKYKKATDAFIRLSKKKDYKNKEDLLHRVCLLCEQGYASLDKNTHKARLIRKCYSTGIEREMDCRRETQRAITKQIAQTPAKSD